MDQVTDFGRDWHGRQPAEKHFFPVCYGYNLFSLEREETQKNHFAAGLVCISKSQGRQFANKFFVDSPHSIPLLEFGRFAGQLFNQRELKSVSATCKSE